MSSRWILFGLIFLLGGCQSAQHKRFALLKDRSVKLTPAAPWVPVECRVEAHLTAPARARYDQMFPAHESALAYHWRARSYGCEVATEVNSPLADNYRSFVETALCLLAQVHWVNSPFASLPAQAENIVEAPPGRVLVRSGPTGDLGVYVDERDFKVETHTKARGILRAEYGPSEGEWLPLSLSQDLRGVVVELDDFEWAPATESRRRLIKSVWLSVGEGKPMRHSRLVFSECHGI